jgi:ABC-type nickel/cobalt efflux system permease component RcnA
MIKRLMAVGVLVGAFVVATASGASAHPLGNFSVNRYAGLIVGPRTVDVDYVVDYAELPTFQLRHEYARGHDRFASATCRELATNVVVRAGVVLRATVTASRMSLHAGQGGLETLRLECNLRAVGDVTSAHRVAFEDGNFRDHVGWREITAVGDHMTITTPGVARTSITHRLTKYPKDRISSPLAQRAISVAVRPGGAAAPTRGDETGAFVSQYGHLTSLLSSSVGARRLTLGLALVALAAAIALGALHAIAPGHGKTVMAAYLVGERGSLRHALVLGATVATTHTIGVLVLGGVLAATQAFAPEQLYPWFGIASGVCFAALGGTLLWRAVTRRRSWHARHHVHAHDHAHPHHDHDHGHDHDHDHDHAPAPAMSHRQLLALGFAGGLVPTPSAVIVLLGATAIGRAWFGVTLVVAYGLGLAATLLAAGVLLSIARHRFELKATSDRLLRLAAVLPIATALLVTGGGLLLVARAALTL